MSSCHQLKIIGVKKGSCHVFAKRVTRSTRAFPPAAVQVSRVTPQQVGHGSLFLHLFEPVYTAVDKIEAGEGGAEPAVHAEYPSLNEPADRQVVKQVSELLPHHSGVPAIFSQALVVEAKDPGAIARLVIAA